MSDKIRIGLIGLGQRSVIFLDGVIFGLDHVQVVAVCDLYDDRQQECANKIKEKTGIMPVCTSNYQDILKMDNVDAVIICTDWSWHVRIACDAMRAGKIVGCEVGGAYSIDDCWELVRTYEETKTPIMMLENCCYGRDELMLLRMVMQGDFGEVVHCQGAYRHDLRSEISEGRENRHYRLNNYRYRNCDNYPTHELGPIAKLLKINRGNRMVSLSSVSSKAVGLHEYLLKTKGAEYDLSSASFMQGDVITTTIRCSGGETIVLTLDTTLPGSYSRGLQVKGTKAAYIEDNQSLFLDGEHNAYDYTWKEHWGNIEKYREKYEHPIWKKYLDDGVRGGHDGIDYLVLNAFFDSIRYHHHMPIDVYDMASWISISALSEQSIATGGQPVPMVDFTGGRWVKPEQAECWQYSLDTF